MKKRQSHKRKILKKKERYWRRKGIELKFMPPREIIIKPLGKDRIVTIKIPLIEERDLSKLWPME